MIDTLTQMLGFPYLVLLLFGCLAIPVAVITGWIFDRKNSGRPIQELPPLHFEAPSFEGPPRHGMSYTHPGSFDQVIPLISGQRRELIKEKETTP